jgi:hypothetical protein
VLIGQDVCICYGKADNRSLRDKKFNNGEEVFVQSREPRRIISFVMILIPFSEVSNFDISDSSIKLRAEILCICSTTHTIHRGNNKVFRTTPDIPLSPAYSYE